jgi:lipopolysaccharide transport system ATP-binding protein
VRPPGVVVDGLWEAYRRRGRSGWRRRGDVTWALRDVSLEVPRGSMLGVVGSNGSGKTTLLQVLAGVLSPTRGTASVDGRVASLVDLSAGFHRDLTGHENLVIGGVLLGVPRAELRRRYDEIVAFSGLAPEALDAPLSSYSAGMGLRLGFSLVVHTDPDVLLVDEVLAVGDESFQRQCVAEVERLQGSGCAVVLVSHDLGLVRRHCDRAALLDGGNLVEVGPPADVVEHHAVSVRSAPDDPLPADRRLFEVSDRARASRRRRGV